MTAAAENLFGLAAGAFATRCLHVVADLGVADHIGDDPVPTARLSASCGADADALGRVLRLLTVHGLFVERDGGWAHTETSRLLAGSAQWTSWRLCSRRPDSRSRG